MNEEGIIVVLVSSRRHHWLRIKTNQLRVNCDKGAGCTHQAARAIQCQTYIQLFEQPLFQEGEGGGGGKKQGGGWAM